MRRELHCLVRVKDTNDVETEYIGNDIKTLPSDIVITLLDGTIILIPNSTISTISVSYLDPDK